MVEVINVTRDYIGTDEERQAMDKSSIYPGSTFYCYDTSIGYIFASGDWRAV